MNAAPFIRRSASRFTTAFSTRRPIRPIRLVPRAAPAPSASTHAIRQRSFSTTPSPPLSYPTPNNASPSASSSSVSPFLLLRVAAAAYVFQLYVANVTIAIGPSMLPTLNARGDLLLTESVSPRLGHVSTGDLVVVYKPTNPRISILKRVRASAGDSLSDGRTVPDDHVWLQGDNPAQSTDSRHYGAVPMSLVRSKVVCRIWPPRQVGVFDKHVPPR